MIELKHLSKEYPMSDKTVEALKDVNLTIQDGDIYGIIGMSGAGKSTLVRCINLLERPTEGEVLIDGENVCTMSDERLRELRRNVTMIFQHFNLLQQRTCLDNVCFPLELIHVPKDKARERALELLDIVGLKDKADSYPSQLSGGQQQRVAIARALATEPKILLCDEATSALDPNTTHAILELIREINKKMGLTVVIITHQMSVVEDICNHVAILDEGVVVEEGVVGEVFSNPKSAAARRLVFPEGEGDSIIAGREGERFIRLVFNGAEATSSPLIANMALECGIPANISSASTRAISGKIYGKMLLGIQGDDATIEKAIAYLSRDKEVFAEEVKIHG